VQVVVVQVAVVVVTVCSYIMLHLLLRAVLEVGPDLLAQMEWKTVTAEEVVAVAVAVYYLV
jgi:hypothetical protein